MLVPYNLPGFKRVWFVPGLRVWGSPNSFTIDFLVAEHPDTPIIHFGTAQIGELAQTLTYAELVDSRGNHLPDEIDAPKVIVRPRGDESAHVVGQEDDESFKIARSGTSPEAVTIDLLILEMGR